ASTYVDTEVAWWVRHTGAQRMLLVHAGGTIGWDRAAGEFTVESAIPPALRGAYAEEPRWVDMTWFGAPGSLQTADPRFTERIADLSAAVRDVPRDQLIGENVRQHRKARRLARSAIAGLAVLLVLALVAGAVAFVQRSEAVRQRDLAAQQSLIARVGQLAATAVTAAQTDLQTSLALATTAYRTRPDSATLQALHEVLTTTAQLDEFITFDGPLSTVDGTPDAKLIVAGSDSGTVYLDDRQSGHRGELMDLGGPIQFLAVSDDGRTVAASARHDDAPDAGRYSSAIWRDGTVTELPGTEIVAMSPSGDTTAALPAKEPPIENAHFEIRHNGRTTELRTDIASRGNRPWTRLPDDRTLAAMDMAGNYIRMSLDGATQASTRGPMKAWMLAVAGISGDGSRFGYVTDLNAVEVWDLTGTPPPTLGDDVLAADSGGVQATDVALDSRGTRMAVAGDGRIFVGAVHPRGAAPQLTELRGAGARPHSLQFLSDELLLSASGSTAALWDLRRTTPLTAVTDLTVGKTCNACGPPQVAVSPDAAKVLVIGSSGTTAANLLTGYVARHEATFDAPASGDLDAALTAQPTALWLDADRVFVYAPSTGDGFVVGGPRMDRVEQRLDLPRADGTARAALRADGVVAAAVDGRLLLIDPAHGGHDPTTLPATNVTANGAYAIHVPERDDSSATHVTLIDTYTEERVGEWDISGRLLDFAAHTSDGITLLRMLDSSGYQADTEVLRLDPRDGHTDVIGRLGYRMVTPEQGVVAGDEMFAEANGVVVRYDLRDASRLPLLPVTSAIKAWNGLGLPQNGQTLFVASEPTQTLSRVPVAADEWMRIACRAAGRAPADTDIARVVGSLDGLQIGCR
ncbi:WD40 repeat domain-containing protein, partial [Mycolicibacterium sp.]|uniref:WD40 repeat domain-containing protein n=1 Tax=Mycolicibacterium sp. TaxID=2320850 RepID=UPI003D0C4AB5